MPSQSMVSTRSRRNFLGWASKAGTLGAVAAATTIATPSVARAATASATATSAVGTPVLTELGYAETLGGALGTTTSVVVPNLVLRVTLGGGPVGVEYGGYVTSSVAGGMVKLYLLRDGTAVHEIGATVAAAGLSYLRGQCRLAPTASTTSNFTILLANWTPNATARVIPTPLCPAFVQARLL